MKSFGTFPEASLKAVLMFALSSVLFTGCTGGGGSKAPSATPEITIEDASKVEINELWKSLPDDYAFSAEELQLIETEILNNNSDDLENEEIAKLIESEKENIKGEESK